MKYNKMKHAICFLLTIAICLPIIIMAGCNGGESGDKKSAPEAFYDAVVESQSRLDIIADAIYTNWYNAIYKDMFGKSIDLAIASALSSNSENVDFIESNEVEIQSLYKKARDSEFKDEVKDVMNAYSDYYEFVINVSGSFNSYSSSKETLKKELANALKHLSMEL